MRYADISAPTGGEGIPDMPSIPAGYAPTRSMSPEQDGEGDIGVPKGRRAEEQKAAEMKMLDEKVFDPDACEPVQSQTSQDRLMLSRRPQAQAC
jgi:hypothetical protein